MNKIKTALIGLTALLVARSLSAKEPSLYSLDQLVDNKVELTGNFDDTKIMTLRVYNAEENIEITYQDSLFGLKKEIYTPKPKTIQKVIEMIGRYKNVSPSPFQEELLPDIKTKFKKNIYNNKGIFSW